MASRPATNGASGCIDPDAADCVFELVKAVQFDNVSAVRRQGETLIREQPDNALVVRIGATTQGSSVTVALLLAWLRAARGDGKHLRFANVPDDLRNIIEFSGLTEVLL